MGEAMGTWMGLGALVLGVGLAGCQEASEAPAGAPMLPQRQMELAKVAAAPAPGPQTMGESISAAPAAQASYLAERQYWVLELEEKAVESRWQTHLALCRQGCEVLNASIVKSRHLPVSAQLQLRVARTTAPGLLAALNSPEVSERRVEREDKTLEVVDVEARQKNQARLRDRLRELLQRPGGGLKDVLETERELARVQGELDALAARRQVLANETEKILLHLEYRPAPSIAETGAFQPLAEAWHSLGRSFAESLAQALTFLVAALPWLFLVLPAVWGGWKLVGRLFRWRRNKDYGA